MNSKKFHFSREFSLISENQISVVALLLAYFCDSYDWAEVQKFIYVIGIFHEGFGSSRSWISFLLDHRVGCFRIPKLLHQISLSKVFCQSCKNDLRVAPLITDCNDDNLWINANRIHVSLSRNRKLRQTDKQDKLTFFRQVIMSYVIIKIAALASIWFTIYFEVPFSKMSKYILPKKSRKKL